MTKNPVIKSLDKMNNDMKCPICGTILDKAFINDKIRGCPKCRNMGNIELWQELIRTRKALDVAVDALEMIDSGKILEHSVFGHENETKTKIAHSALEQITTLEKKSELENLEMLVNNVFK